MTSLTAPAQAFESDTTTLDSAAQHALGTRARDASGNEYIYALGVASTVEGSWVSWGASTYQTALLASSAIGFVGIAQAATVASTYGWYMIWGYEATTASDTVAGAGVLYIDGTAGRVDDAVVAGDLIYGAISTAADTSNVLPAIISYPYVNDQLLVN